ncbi:MAG: phytanoyl-CoA dioxygenase family protein [Desulfobacterales bacterium]|nr:phytanoyl-CoA dioxygenase family protein [Desulfobacterales bacterium]MDP3316658.1 phytanoyl-CoA dioxygenase family protein [Devosia sp.]
MSDATAGTAPAPNPAATLPPLIDAQGIRAFRRHGWVRVRGVLNAAQMAQIVKSWDKALEAPPKHSDIYPSERNRADNVRQEDPESRKILQIVRELRFFDPAMDAIARDARVGEMVRGLLGVAHARLLSEAYLEKPPASQGSKETPWHQDYCYEPLDRRNSLNVWIALQDIAAQQGALEFLSGSHRLGPMGRLEFTKSSDLSGVLLEEDLELMWSLRHEDDVKGPFGAPLARPDVKAGDALVFHGLTFHGAGPNTTELRRRAYQRFFIGADVRYNAMPDRRTDGLGMSMGDHFESDRFPLVS